MTQIDTVYQTDENSQSDRRVFLRALYGSSPDDLFLEIRCIHPLTEEVRTLWGRMGNKRELAARLKQAGALNREGFGVYFAPCLRREKKGNAEAAAWVPALWIDIDGGEQQREHNLEKLRSFDPAPSFIIDSGGGWHGYWLLDAPFQLNDEVDRQKIAAILRGLFSALDGDPSYVKSVASVMRLPGSVNTKPERGGVVVNVVEAHPERRYSLSAFDWLESQPHREQIGGLKVITLNENGQHSLPLRTEQYFTSGAPEGQRNTELFAAACQLRDAGYSHSDAEQQLLPRHLADGGGEREAQATILSAYSRPPREPIHAPAAAAREQVAQLVGSYAPDQRQEHPSAEQIGEVVRACAHLNAVEWAEERHRLKAVCGEGLRLVDLDRLYRDARRDLERQSLPSEDRYLVVDGCIVYEKVTERGLSRQKITDWTAQLVERSSRIDDDGQVEHLVRLELSRLGKTQPLVVPSELFGDANALHRHIARQAGERFIARTGMSKHLPTALLSLSEDYPTRMTYRFMGWTQIDGHWAYVTSGLTINANGVCEQPSEVELELRLRDYGLRVVGWSQSTAAFAAFKDILPEANAPALIAYAFLPLVQRFFPASAPKPALHLQGTTGTGKSEIASLLCSFYGQFTRDLPPSQWGDTVNTVETLGYSLADALYWVDDYKTIYADERTFTRFLQSYSRGMGRGRLTREAKIRQERPCRGHILSTGETTIEGEASVLSRMIVLEIPPWEARDPAGQALMRADEQREALSGFTARFIQWIASQADSDTLAKQLAAGFEQNARDYQDKLRGKLERQAHTGRMVQNWAVLATVYQLLHDFLLELRADSLLPVWQDSIVETVQGVQQERAGQIFLNLLGQLVAGGQCVIADSLRNPGDPAPGATIIGYRDQGFVYLLPEIAYREVSKIQPLKFTAHAIGSQLKEDGILIPGNSNLSVQRTVRGGVVRLWRIKSENFGCEGCETD